LDDDDQPLQNIKEEIQKPKAAIGKPQAAAEAETLAASDIEPSKWKTRFSSQLMLPLRISLR
jgi:hypothetical protein